jgi:hypothetical protein
MRTKMVVLGALVAGAVTVGAVLPALAQDRSETSNSEEEPTEDGAWPRGPGLRGVHSDAFAADLAEELGLEVDEVTAAIEKVGAAHREQLQVTRTARLQERLDAAVEAGRLTQEEADAWVEAHEAGDRPMRGEGFGPGDGPFPRGEGARGRGGHGGMHGRAMLDG